MQKNRFDNWLRKKFAYRTQILCHRLPDEGASLLKKARVHEHSKEGGQRFQYEVLFKKEALGERFIQLLRNKNMIYSTNVVQNSGRFAKFLCKPQQSVTYVIIWRIIILFFVLGLTYLTLLILRNPAVLEILRNAWEELKSLTS